MNALIFSAVFGAASFCLACDIPNDVPLLTPEQLALESSQDTADPPQLPETDSQATAAVAALECDLSAVMNSKTYAYFLAPGGLYLSAHDNLHSERLTLMPWGSKVLVEQAPQNNTMTVGGIPGAMYGVRFNDLEGFAFSGYLGPYTPPSHKMNAAQYTAHLIENQPEHSESLEIPQYTRTVSDDLTAPSVSESLFMPRMNLNQAYLVAQRLFGIPEDLKCPSVAGPENAVYPDKKPKKGIWKSELAVRRAQGQIQEMTYVYRSKNFMRRVSLTPRDNGVLIQAHDANIL